ncbi:MAG: hypothetical protein DRO12_02980 [Thermoprotei archaeon]|nr:MAG: hypothetical protein DRO12_02980 [Thermoprotei archaeon]
MLRDSQKHYIIFGKGRIVLNDALFVLPSPWLIGTIPRKELRERGIYVGIDLFQGVPVFWNITASPNPHILVLGPSGMGKTETLISLALRIQRGFNADLVMIDLKNELEHKLALRNIKPLVLEAERDPVGILCALRQEQLLLTTFIKSLLSLVRPGEYGGYYLRLLRDALKNATTWRDVKNYLLNTVSLSEDAELVEMLEILEVIDPVNCSKIHRVMWLDPPSQRPVVVQFARVTYIPDHLLSLIMSLLATSLCLCKKDNALATPKSLKRVVVLDEAWTLGRQGLNTLSRVLRLSRSYGTAVLIASQSPDDLEPYTSVIAENVGLFIALASTSRNYWRQVSKIVKLSREDVEYALTKLNIGEGVMRIAPDSRPLFVYVDILPP